MNSKWTTARLKDLALINRESYSRSDGWDFVNYLDTGSITKGVIDKITLIDLRHEKLPSRARRKVAPYDIIYSTVRPNQEHYGIIRHPVANMLVSTGFVTITAKEGVDAQYLYYYLSQPQITTYLHAIAEQRVSTYPALNVSDLEELPITVPPLRIQQEIGEMLSCLDAKIDINNRINENLEKQAQTIFRSWFVDFEPFRNGEFIDSDLGMIPKGWRVGKLGELGTIVGGATPRKSNKEFYEKQEIPWITPKDLSIQRTTFVSRGEVDISEKGLENSGVKLIPRGAVLFSSRAPIGYMAIAKNPLGTNQGFKSVVPLKEFGTPFIYNLLRAYLPRIQALGSGSTFKEVSGSVMRSVPVIVPDLQYVQNYNALVQPMYDLIETLESENQILAALRDTLLPKLMSGEIEVPVV